MSKMTETRGAELDQAFKARLKTEQSACDAIDLLNAAIWAEQVSVAPDVASGVRRAATGVAKSLRRIYANAFLAESEARRLRKVVEGLVEKLRKEVEGAYMTGDPVIDARTETQVCMANKFVGELSTALTSKEK